MRIALLAPVALPVPPAGYGGTELVVSLLADGLVARGHDVTLFASGDSCTSARLRACYPRHLEALGVTDRLAYRPYEVSHVAWAFAQSGEFDLIHDHTKDLGTLFSRFCPTPVVTTIHNDFTPERRSAYGAFPEHPYVAISHAHAARMPELNYAGVVYNGLDLADTAFRADKDDYLLFLGRLDEVKGAHTAARVAQALDMPLVMAGRVAPKDHAFYTREVEPYLDGVKRRYVGEVTGRPKWDLYAGARALLFPIAWAEPFGLVMIEAMAAGTPVVATRMGSVGEVVEDGVTGCLVEPPGDLESFVAATRAALTLSPAACRTRVERHFSAEKMVDDYVRVYERVLAGHGAPKLAPSQPVA
jgi:glycosyltransferase involved in cell wall biosynthesis